MATATTLVVAHRLSTVRRADRIVSSCAARSSRAARTTSCSRKGPSTEALRAPVPRPECRKPPGTTRSSARRAGAAGKGVDADAARGRRRRADSATRGPRFVLPPARELAVRASVTVAWSGRSPSCSAATQASRNAAAGALRHLQQRRWAAVHRSTLGSIEGYASKTSSPFATLRPSPPSSTSPGERGHGERVTEPKDLMRPCRELQGGKRREAQALVNVCLQASYVKTS